MKFTAIVLVCIAIAIERGSAKGTCQSSLFLDDDPVLLNLAEYAGCTVKIATSENRIIAFHRVDGLISDLAQHVKIVNGHEPHTSDVVSLEAGDHEKLKKINVNYAKTVYSSGMAAVLEIDSRVSTGLHLKISKAVICPFNLGPESQCGRVVDEVSCYCAVFTERIWNDQKTFCTGKGFNLLTVETEREEFAIYASWGKTTQFWTSLNDLQTEGLWKWDSTGGSLYPGYANWDIGEPNNSGGNEDCAILNKATIYGGWDDCQCSKLYGAVCELQPM